jgi:hypothetical protein
VGLDRSGSNEVIPENAEGIYPEPIPKLVHDGEWILALRFAAAGMTTDGV